MNNCLTKYECMKTKSLYLNKRRSGFTLVELLAVIAIIAILGGISMGSFQFFQKKATKDKTIVQLKLLSNAIQDYKADWGVVPTKPASDLKPSNAPANVAPWNLDSSTGNGDPSKCTIGLVQALHPLVTATSSKSKIYLSELNPNGASGGFTLTTVGSNRLIADPYGRNYYYRSDRLVTQVNPDFDLWSAGVDGQSNFIRTSPQALDDIWAP